jgi:hypothetical protein
MALERNAQAVEQRADAAQQAIRRSALDGPDGVKHASVLAYETHQQVSVVTGGQVERTFIVTLVSGTRPLGERLFAPTADSGK